ncbi:MAG: DUF4315 family protein [Lachnospiraceae bacterium]|nr:DUF4315 family protein [Lachnospiraceae bacterium]
MNKKISRQLEDIDRTEKKMAELQEHLDTVRASLKVDEDEEIVRSIRGMNVMGWDLLTLLDGIQNGTVKFYQEEIPEPRPDVSPDSKGTRRRKPVPDQEVPEMAQEREDNDENKD